MIGTMAFYTFNKNNIFLCINIRRREMNTNINIYNNNNINEIINLPTHKYSINVFKVTLKIVATEICFNITFT